MSALHRRLLEIPDRRETIAAELLRFFKGDPKELVRFVRSFSGCVELKIPDLQAVERWDRDVEIARQISHDMSNDARVQLCREYKVTHRHLEELHRAAHGRDLLVPECSATLPARIAEAGRLLVAFPGSEKTVCEMFRLTPAQARSGKKK